MAAKDTEIEALRSGQQALGAQVEALLAEVADLRARLGANPRNSSRPPSSEGLGKPSPKSLRGRSGRRPGRPPGQPVATLEMTDSPDQVAGHDPAACRSCRGNLAGAAEAAPGLSPGPARPRGSPSKIEKKARALARRLTRRHDDYLRFARDFTVPFDNNAAERGIRMGKLRIKVSGCMRSLTGAGHFCAIRSYLATAARHGTSALDALIRAAEGQPWLPGTA